MEVVDLDISNMIHNQVGNFQTYKLKIIDKDGKVFLRIKIGDLVELEEEVG
jgi:hypothetical protein